MWFNLQCSIAVFRLTRALPEKRDLEPANLVVQGQTEQSGTTSCIHSTICSVANQLSAAALRPALQADMHAWQVLCLNTTTMQLASSTCSCVCWRCCCCCWDRDGRLRRSNQRCGCCCRNRLSQLQAVWLVACHQGCDLQVWRAACGCCCCRCRHRGRLQEGAQAGSNVGTGHE